MTDTTGALPPAGWYPDPYGSPQERWWDGTGWTQHMNTAAPAAPVQPATPAEPVAPEQPVYAQPEPVAYTEPEPIAYAQPEPAAYTPPVLDEPQAPADPFAGFVSPASFPTPAVAEPAYPEPVQQPAAAWPVEPAAATTTGPLWDPAPQPTYTPPAQGYAEQSYAEQNPFGAQPTTQQPAFEQPVAAPAAASDYTSGSFFAPTEVPADQPDVPQPAASSQASSFDFGFGDIISGGAAPSNASVPANGSVAAGSSVPSEGSVPADGDSGLFGSWEPNEYVEPARNSLATAGLTLGILSFLLSAIAGVPGIIISALGLSRAARSDRDGDGPVGRGKAIAGLALSVIGTAASIALILYGLPLLLQGLQSQSAVDPNGDGTSTLTDVETTANGGIALAIGDVGTITLPDSSDAAIQFSVTEITPNFTCTAEDAAGPENGQFVAVAMNLTLAAEYPTRMVDGAQLAMNQSDWIGFQPDGTQVQSTDAAATCLPEAEQLQGSFTPGESSSIVMVLDMSTTVTSVSWSPSGVLNLDPGITRWEWALA